MLKSIIQASPVYPVARGIYRAIFKSSQVAAAERMNSFYAQFFQPGEIVFDVGANQGEYAECFAKEGATVIAVEPNVAHRPRLQALAKYLPIIPEYVAISERRGVATLNLCSTSGYSTLSDSNSDWMATSPDYASVKWLGSTQVGTATLDDLVEKHGWPAFVKIDIEGYELSALKGMSFDPRYISFEYGVRRKEIALNCVSLLAVRGYRFRPIDGRDFRFTSVDWMTLSDATEWLRSRTVQDGEYGDMFAYKWPV